MLKNTYSRVGAVAVGTLMLIGVAGVGGAYAGSQITSHDIKNQTIQSQDIDAGGVGGSEVRNQSLHSWDIDSGGVGRSEIKNGSVHREDLAKYMESQVYKKHDVSGYEIVGRGTDSVTVPAGTTQTVTTKCSTENTAANATKVALSGGAKVAGPASIGASFPDGIEQVGGETDTDPAGLWVAKGWSVKVTAGDSDATVQPYVTCGDVSTANNVK